jgi:glycosyltransferase involved in cell wall biosynthesis
VTASGSSNTPAGIPVTVMIFTLNEELHLPPCLDSLRDFDDVIVVDSYSSDRTEAICVERGVRFFQNKFEGFGTQRNWAFDEIESRHDWVLILDADERVPPELAREIDGIVRQPRNETGAYRVRRRFYMWGRWLRYSSLYPTWVVRLVDKTRVRYVNRGHAETQLVDGATGSLSCDLIDENLKGIDEWFARQNRYTTKDAEFELEAESGSLSLAHMFSGDPLVRRALAKRLAMKMPLRPFFYFLYSYIVRMGFLDGRDGLVFCTMKALHQRMILVKKYDLRRQRRSL